MRRCWIIALAALLATTMIASAADDVLTPVASADVGPALLDTLHEPEAWRGYRAHFVTESGRVVDTGNRGISHSEGQGYGMLLAVAANDRATFDLIWGWTRANLMVRDDELLAWRWEPDQRPAVSDMNDAADGDLLVAWALTEAAEAWGAQPYRIAARRIAVEVGRKLVLWHGAHGAELLPGVLGFAAEDRPDGPVVNLSYWVFPAFARLPLVAPDFDWARLSRDGIELLRHARFGEARLPTDWVSLHQPEPRPADGFAPRFAYNALRIPLYVAWAGLGRDDLYAPFVATWRPDERPALPLVDVTTGHVTETLGEPGYATIAALAACAAAGRPFAVAARRPHVEGTYYAATLDLLARVAARTRYPSCLDR